jgi:hypothetical protein
MQHLREAALGWSCVREALVSRLGVLNYGTQIDLEKVAMKLNVKTCRICSHSRAAHSGRDRCALCHCTGRPQSYEQEAFQFRRGEHSNVTGDTRKR